ncbi:uncharacterized protein LOC133711201 [Rosa rugosa]|uniref:uncharacterized protein LOC133711201 n=1 Tax=Rosa rugosa TaxID=74645 RepID=UPI002B412141|nr:uncharacterized protein LOC133711201 [Rosa rugosa]
MVQDSSSIASVPPGFSKLDGTPEVGTCRNELETTDDVTSIRNQEVNANDVIPIRKPEVLLHEALEEGEFTPVVTKKAKKLQKRSLGLQLVTTNNRGLQAPNMWFLCHEALRVQVISASDQQISVSCSFEGVSCTLTAVYAKTTIAGRRHLWQELNQIHSQHGQGPRLVFGDFNCILGAHEKRGGALPNGTSCLEFSQMCSDCELLDIPTKGLAYTWSNGHTEVKLDRALGNMEWMTSWNSMDCCTLTKATSDHCPILVSCSKLDAISRPHFKFQSLWLQTPDFLALVRSFWNSLHYHGCPQFILAAKLRALKGMLKLWSKEQVGDVHAQVTHSKAALDAVQAEISTHGLSDERLNVENTAHNSYLAALSLQATLLRDKSRIRWLKDGDRNTTFLHNMVKVRRLQNSITSLLVEDRVHNDQAAIATHAVQHFESCFTHDHQIGVTGLVERVIPHMVTEEENSSLLVTPSAEEIRDAVMKMDGNSAPGPDGFGGCFFTSCWSVVAHDVTRAVQSFFINGYIMPHFNSNILILIPKLEDAESISDFRPIALANFVFKIITRIMADRLGPIASRIISPNQSAFIRGRSIVDPIVLTSECVNLLDQKCKYGNLAIKFDISKAFDTLDWNFLLRVLRAFGFDATFVNYIHTILQSAYISVSVNGQVNGYFTCSRGVRQGDPLSPLLFCLAEEVLSRGLSSLVNRRKIRTIAAPSSVSPPSHVLFADDIMVFLQGKPSHLRNLMSFMDEYAVNSGQVVNKAKSNLLLGRYALPRQNRTCGLLGIRPGQLPFTYLGVPIFIGHPKSVHLVPIADKVRCKLSSWKGKQLSQAGRLQLISSVIESILIYSFHIYEWPKSLLNKVQSWMRNFFWRGDPLKNGSALVAWSTICFPKSQGGLGLKDLFALNRSLLLKRCWEMASKASTSARFLHDRFLQVGLHPCSSYKKSAIWLGLKKLWPRLLARVQWLLGDGSTIRFWKDNWLGEAVIHSTDYEEEVRKLLNDKVGDFILNGQWNLPPSFCRAFPQVAQVINAVPISSDLAPDQLIWTETSSGTLSSKEAYQVLSPPIPAPPWCARIWHQAIQPRKSMVAWKTLLNRVSTDERLQRRGTRLCSRCYLCRRHSETIDHLFLECVVAASSWAWLHQMFRLLIPPGTSLPDLFLDATLSMLNQSSKLLWFISVCNLLWCLWSERNKRKFEGGECCPSRFKQFFLLSIKESAGLAFVSASSPSSQIPIFGYLGISPLLPSAPRFIPVIWQSPPRSWFKANSDGSYRDLNHAGYGAIFRNCDAAFLGAFSCNAQVSCAIDAELLAVIETRKNGFDQFSDVDGLIISGGGLGVIDGKGSNWWKACDKSDCDRPAALEIRKCDNLRLSGVTHINSAKAHIKFYGCNGVQVSGLLINAPDESPNTDGIQIISSTNVNIDNSAIETGDDCIAISSGSSQIQVSGVRCGPGHGISIGSLGKNGADATVEDVNVRNCTLRGTQNGLRIKTWPGGRGYARNITYEGIRLIGSKNPIIINQHYVDKGLSGPKEAGRKSSVQVSNVTYHGVFGSSAN